MVAEQSSEPRPRDQSAIQPVQHSVCQWSVQWAPDVCNAEHSDDHFNVEFRAEAPWQWKHRGSASWSSTRTRLTTSTRCWQARCRRNRTVSVSCVGNLCRYKMTSTSIHLDGHTLWVRQRFRVEVDGNACSWSLSSIEWWTSRSCNSGRSRSSSCAEDRGEYTNAVPGQGCRQSRCGATPGVHGSGGTENSWSWRKAECVCDCNRKSCNVTVDIDADAAYSHRERCVCCCPSWRCEPRRHIFAAIDCWRQASEEQRFSEPWCWGWELVQFVQFE